MFQLQTRVLSVAFIAFMLVETAQGIKKSYDVASNRGLPTILWWDKITPQNYTIECDIGIECFVTPDRSRLHKQDIMMYAFYGATFLADGLPLPRKDWDLWALFQQDSPRFKHFLFTYESTLELFNYSSTFQRQSHYPVATHWLKSVETLTSKKYLVSTEEKNRLRDEEGYAPIVFVQKDCSTPSDREGFVKQLRQYIDVDSYGLCLNNKEFPEELHDKGDRSFDSPEFLKFIAGYKFAIAIENTVCDDYVTEKLWRPLQVGSVPIVFGAPNVKDFLPNPKSAIVVQDFESIEEVADFIRELDVDDEAYEEYLAFKENGITNPRLMIEMEKLPKNEHSEQSLFMTYSGFECFLCEKLHEVIGADDEGFPVPESQATGQHCVCPLPNKKFDEDGKYTFSYDREMDVKRYEINAEVFREFYDKGKSVPFSTIFTETSQRLHKLRDEL